MFKQITMSLVLSVFGLGCGTDSTVHTDSDDLNLVSSGAVLAKSLPERMSVEVDRSGWRFFSAENNEQDLLKTDVSIDDMIRPHPLNQSIGFMTFVGGMEPNNLGRCDRSNALHRGSGQAQISAPSLIEFARVEIHGPVNVIAEYSPTRAVVIFADDNLISLIESEARNDVLTISAPSRNVCYGIQPRVYVRGPQFGAVSVKEHASLELYELYNRQLDIEVGNGSRVELFGRTNRARLRMSPHSNADLTSLAVDNLAIDMAQHSDAEVLVRKSVIGTMSHGSRIALNSGVENEEIIGDGTVEYTEFTEDDANAPRFEQGIN